jgi:hypothetical protein
MNRLGNRVTQAAKWLAVTLAALMLLAQPLVADTAQPVSKRSSCCKQCPCCVSSNPVNAPVPLVPVSSTRTTVAKDLQLVPVLAVLFAPRCDEAPVLSSDLSASSFSAPVPLFVRHCAFLI